jgi:2'-5' RNA ligase
MNDYKDSAMIALLPTTTDWCRQELPHMTLVYAGTIDTLMETSFNELAKDAAMLAMLTNPLTLSVTGVEVFGDEEKVDVLRLQATSELLAMRRAVERWNASEHSFKPHCTIGPAGAFVSDLPTYLTFDRILCAWGNEDLTFLMKR